MSATADVGTHSSSAIVAAADSFVREELSAMDGSHDWWHVDRVRKTALSLAAEERVPVASLEVVELAALLHDVRDWKYSGDRDAGERAVRAFLERHAYDPERLEAVVDIVANVGFKNELPSDDDGSPSPGGSTANATRSPEFRVVQDADRLDAMGAIGIARTFCYGGAKKNPMHVPGVEPRVEMTRAQYEAAQRGGGGEEDGELGPTPSSITSTRTARPQGVDEERRGAAEGGEEARDDAAVSDVPRRVGRRE